MSDKVYVVEGRQFRTETNYKMACRDRDTIEKLRNFIGEGDITELKKVKTLLQSGKVHFYTLLGQDFEDEIDSLIRKAEKSENVKSNSSGSKNRKKKDKENKSKISVSDSLVEEALKKREKNRKMIVTLCSVTAIVCIGYLTIYSFFIQRTDSEYEKWGEIRENGLSDSSISSDSEADIHYESNTTVVPEVLEEYKILLNKNKKLIGWVKIDDTNIDYPVMQTTDNIYYLDHNLNQEYDNNGSIFMDKDCDVIKPSTNFILYGHHMKSGKMFGGLDKYQNESYAKEHPYITFDTIYEHGKYQVMYVFRSRVYSEEDVNFKYYQFIDALSDTEFDSYMKEMADMSLYDTGVTAQFGDRLLTLSTCDYKEENGRFVVVAKKID